LTRAKHKKKRQNGRGSNAEAVNFIFCQTGNEKDLAGILYSRLLSVMLNACGAQASEAVTFDGTLPAQKFFYREGVACARILKA